MPALSISSLDKSSFPSYVLSMGQTAPISVEELLADLSDSLPSGSLRMPFTIREVRKLTQEDLVAGERVKVAARPKQTLQKIRQSHHSMARMVALGKSNIEISEVIGVTPQRITTLKADPAFQELISYYQSMTDDVYVNVAERIAGFTTDAMEVLHERILENPDAVKTDDIIKVISMGLDRTGYGPKSTQNINQRVMVVTDAELDRIKQEATLRRVGAIRSLPTSEEPALGQSMPGSLPLQIEVEAEGIESQGPFLREEIPEDAQDESSEGSGPPDLPVDRV